MIVAFGLSLLTIAVFYTAMMISAQPEPDYIAKAELELLKQKQQTQTSHAEKLAA